jgi:hypothetical protein
MESTNRWKKKSSSPAGRQAQSPRYEFKDSSVTYMVRPTARHSLSELMPV